MKNNFNQWLVLALFITLSFSAAFFGGLFTESSVDSWYRAINKPSWTPPNWIFGPVWTMLYLSMAVAAWLVWRESGFAGAIPPFVLFGIQLVLNATWSVAFFGLQSPKLGFINIIFLWGFILATLIAFWRIKPLSGWLFMPYLLWVTFAATLNWTIWRLNS
ncbi:MAG: tryptophan-rich sensory protein [candidate division KSB1 bacterium]|nr:tryptophan-rich sensory protein [candidate division KSB1 bacterium]MDZ7302506.1 tryptophan-rich sensory protein [candidate division KSB1 bacterium]MDZ7311898.1 tryptophan-rich sensory protein [candidate division KSB1 bacterium]